MSAALPRPNLAKFLVVATFLWWVGFGVVEVKSLFMFGSVWFCHYVLHDVVGRIYHCSLLTWMMDGKNWLREVPVDFI
jgi:hypothetical protein